MAKTRKYQNDNEILLTAIKNLIEYAHFSFCFIKQVYKI